MIAIAAVYIGVMVMLLWFIVYAKGRVVIKCIVAGVVLWFAIALYYLAPNMTGWPVIDDIPDGSIIISVRIVEPDQNDAGAFYFWCNLQPDLKKATINLFNPEKLFAYTGNLKPRAYQVPYDRELHKRILDAQRKQKRVGGSWIEIKKGEQRKGINELTEKMKFKIVNPFGMLTKEAE